MKRIALVLAFTLMLGCAVQHSKAPQIDAKTAYALNLESQVTQANRDYISFFTDVGTAQRSGLLTANDVVALNKIGTHLKPILEEADRLAKAYGSSYDAGTAATIGSLLSQIAADLTTLNLELAKAKGGTHN